MRQYQAKQDLSSFRKSSWITQQSHSCCSEIEKETEERASERAWEWEIQWRRGSGNACGWVCWGCEGRTGLLWFVLLFRLAQCQGRVEGLQSGWQPCWLQSVICRLRRISVWGMKWLCENWSPARFWKTKWFSYYWKEATPCLETLSCSSYTLFSTKIPKCLIDPWQFCWAYRHKQMTSCNISDCQTIKNKLSFIVQAKQTLAEFSVKSKNIWTIYIIKPRSML